ncbi:MAG: hypothetical protein ACI8RA_001731 [Chlamydiales bacterium]|jgi:hypothetical protein
MEPLWAHPRISLIISMISKEGLDEQAIYLGI